MSVDRTELEQTDARNLLAKGFRDGEELKVPFQIRADQVFGDPAQMNKALIEAGKRTLFLSDGIDNTTAFVGAEMGASQQGYVQAYLVFNSEKVESRVR